MKILHTVKPAKAMKIQFDGCGCLAPVIEGWRKPEVGDDWYDWTVESVQEIVDFTGDEYDREVYGYTYWILGYTDEDGEKQEDCVALKSYYTLAEYQEYWEENFGKIIYTSIKSHGKDYTYDEVKDKLLVDDDGMGVNCNITTVEDEGELNVSIEPFNN